MYLPLTHRSQCVRSPLLLWIMLFAIFACTLPLNSQICETQPSPPATVVAEANAVAAYQQVVSHEAGCVAAGDAGCTAQKANLNALFAEVSNEALHSRNCTSLGATYPAPPGGTLSAADLKWYAVRSKFWNDWYFDMYKSIGQVNDGTYRIPVDFRSTLVGVAPPVPPPPPPAPAPKVPAFLSTTPVRVIGGIEVSAASSADPAAKFLLDASLEQPLTARKIDTDPKNTDTNLLGAWFWASGYVRLSSITQPGPVNGVTNVATYIQPLLSNTPDHLVQSAEAGFYLEENLHSFVKRNATDISDPAVTLHLVTGGGVITPLSPSQANPTVYQISSALYNFYNNNNDDLSKSAVNAIKVTCPNASSSYDFVANPCYIAFLPQSRSRFYRNWEAGFRLRSYYKRPDADTFLYPNAFTATFGQNEYVTGGQMRHFVLHLAGSSSIPPSIAPKLAGLLYAFGAVDVNVNGKNLSQQQFLLQTAASVAASDPKVAVVPTSAPTRDRYRFGLALDLGKLISLAMTGK